MKHSDFWVAIATAAPVIGLTHVVVWGQMLRRAASGRDLLAAARKSTAWSRRPRHMRMLGTVIARIGAVGPYAMGFFGFAFTAVALAEALIALATDVESDRGLAASLVLIAMILTAAQAGLAATTDEILSDLEDEATRPDPLD